MTPARLRLAIILAGIAVAGLAMLAWTQPWFELTLSGSQRLTVAGQDAAPALSALGLASLALLGALSIAGRGVRIGLGVVEAAIGILVAVVAAGALAAPITASAGLITETTAISGPESVAALVTALVVTPWPVVAIAAGALTTVVGVAVIVTARRWPGPTRKYDTGSRTESGTPVGAWDSLSDGSDPTR